MNELNQKIKTREVKQDPLVFLQKKKKKTKKQKKDMNMSLNLNLTTYSPTTTDEEVPKVFFSSFSGIIVSYVVCSFCVIVQIIMMLVHTVSCTSFYLTIK